MPQAYNQIILAGVGGLGLVTVVLLILLFIINRNRQAKLQEQVQAWETGYHTAIQELSWEISQQTASGQTETATLLRGMNDSLINTLTNISSNQTMQLESMQRHTQNSGLSSEQRLDRLQKAIEDNLQKYDQRTTDLAKLIDEKLNQNENRLEKMRETLSDSMGRMQTENAQKLEEMRKTVDEKLHETLDKRLGESFSQVSQRLEQVYKGLGEMQSLASGVGDLKKVLSNVKTRGIWGEMQLGNLLSQVLTFGQYEENVAVKPGSQERVEFALRLPGREAGNQKPVYLPIDSKFPQEDFLRLMEAEQEGDVQKATDARKTLGAVLKSEAKRIADKYIDPPHTTDFAILFLPLEGLYAEAMRSMDLVEEVQRQHRVVLAGPSTLTALLNSLQMGFRTLAIEQRSAEVWKLLGAVKTDFGNFAKVLDKTQERLRQASETIDSAYVRTRSIERHLRRVEALDEEQTKALLLKEGSEDLLGDEQS